MNCFPSAHRLFIDRFAPIFWASRAWFSRDAYLAGRLELQWSKGSLHVGDVRLELIEGSGYLNLNVGGLLSRCAVGSNLVENLGGCFGRHGDR